MGKEFFICLFRSYTVCTKVKRWFLRLHCRRRGREESRWGRGGGGGRGHWSRDASFLWSTSLPV